MIAHLHGIPVQTGDKWAVIDTGSIGYRVNVPQPVAQELSRATGKVTLYTHMVVREDAVALYGFLHQSDLEMFTILIGVTGIGTQLALAILSQMPVGEFAMAIINGDEKALTQISGIGKKSAQRLILELRDKMNAISKSLAAGGLGGYAPEIRDAVSALVSLGFPESDARNAVSSAAEKMVNPSLQALIKAALAVLKVQ